MKKKSGIWGYLLVVSPRVPPVVLFSRRWCMAIPPHPIRRIFLPSMVRGEPATPHPSYFSFIGGAWRLPHAPPVVFFSHRWCVVSLPRLTCRVILPSMVHGDPPTPHPSYFSLIDGAWRVCRAPPVVFFSHR